MSAFMVGLLKMLLGVALAWVCIWVLAVMVVNSLFLKDGQRTEKDGGQEKAEEES